MKLIPSALPIEADRKPLLDAIAAEIIERIKIQGLARLHFICTHNSRRSQLAQAWAAAAAHQYGLPVVCYSGGVEVTACHERTVAALQRAGFDIASDGAMPNPRYRLSAQGEVLAVLYSKLYDDPQNPAEGFLALMTCSEADENCPFIPGAVRRMPLRYEDPKHADGTEGETAAYDRCSRLIASEIAYIFHKVNLHV